MANKKTKKKIIILIIIKKIRRKCSKNLISILKKKSTTRRVKNSRLGIVKKITRIIGIRIWSHKNTESLLEKEG